MHESDFRFNQPLGAALGGSMSPETAPEEVRVRPTLPSVLVSQVMNGWILEVGCKRAVFTSWPAMVENLRAYFENPEPVQRQWLQLKLDFDA